MLLCSMTDYVRDVCATCVAGNVGFLGFGNDEATDSFHVPKQMLVGLAYAVFISSALCYGAAGPT